MTPADEGAAVRLTDEVTLEQALKNLAIRATEPRYPNYEGSIQRRHRLEAVAVLAALKEAETQLDDSCERWLREVGKRERAEALNARLREALKPLAAIRTVVGAHYAAHPAFGPSEQSITTEQVEAAAALLAEADGELK